LSFEDVVYLGGSSAVAKTEADSSNVMTIKPTAGMFDYCEVRPCDVL